MSPYLVGIIFGYYFCYDLPSIKRFSHLSSIFMFSFAPLLKIHHSYGGIFKYLRLQTNSFFIFLNRFDEPFCYTYIFYFISLARRYSPISSAISMLVMCIISCFETIKSIESQGCFSPTHNLVFF